MQGSFAHDLGGLTPNQKAVAHNLDNVVGDHRADKLIDFLDQEPLGSLRSNLDKIAPEELASVFNIGVSLANVQTANLTSEEPAGQNRRAFSGRDPRAAAGESGLLPPTAARCL